MTREDFLKQQFVTLREEIKEGKARIFRLLILGALLIPAAGFVAHEYGSTFAVSSMPFVILVLMLDFIVEQNSIVRAGRYLREHIEPHVKDVTGWESWLETQRSHREVDRLFFGTYLLVFFIFYATASGAAIEVLVREYRDFYYYAGLGYAVGGMWFVVVLLRHWRSSTTTKP